VAAIEVNSIPSLFAWTKKKEQKMPRRILKRKSSEIPPTFHHNTKAAYFSEFLLASVSRNCCSEMLQICITGVSVSVYIF